MVPLAQDTLLGHRYRLSRRIAMGGMGEVWTAEDTVLHRTVAVKVLKSELTQDQTFLERFRTEARTTASLQHNGIANVFDYGEAAQAADTIPLAYLVMEYVDGEPLSAQLARDGRLPAVRVLEVVRQAGLALSEAHRAGMVHRDVKPGNLLVRKSDGAVKITDFGIARAADAVPLTQNGMVVGTAQYFSPEQAEGRLVGPPSDVYSLGIVAYECLAGRLPFVADSPVTVAMMQIRDVPPPLPPDVPGSVQALVMRTLAKDPRQRFANGGELADAVRAVQEGRPPFPGPPPAAGPFPPFPPGPFPSAPFAPAAGPFPAGVGPGAYTAQSGAAGLGGPAAAPTLSPGPQTPGPQTPGPQTPGPQTPGPQTPGPQTPGPQTPGPQTPGPQTPGPQTSAPAGAGASVAQHGVPPQTGTGSAGSAGRSGGAGGPGGLTSHGSPNGLGSPNGAGPGGPAGSGGSGSGSGPGGAGPAGNDPGVPGTGSNPGAPGTTGTTLGTAPPAPNLGAPGNHGTGSPGGPGPARVGPDGVGGTNPALAYPPWTGAPSTGWPAAPPGDRRRRRGSRRPFWIALVLLLALVAAGIATVLMSANGHDSSLGPTTAVSLYSRHWNTEVSMGPMTTRVR